MKKIQKRYIFVVLIVIMVCLLIWKFSTSYALMDIGFSGNNIISGDKWGVNIIEVSEVEKIGDAELIGDISTIGTTLNFNAILRKKGDKIVFNITIENTSKLDAELYALTLSGLSNEAGENISYTILPLDYTIIHSDNKDGSIIKSGEKQMFNITVSYDENVSINNNTEYNLNLGSTIIYKQK